ncbi:hypothetical protein IHE44_0011077 [Lamprotornis superbus]|uniref:Uncharacterized protein n=1 Tax=Lamprotornis superbus TaxID=245042 RepID=A0A835NH55_9PASS|nr:hypothetical protein IHE44_0011077 [Lamprotornis superbus]
MGACRPPGSSTGCPHSVRGSTASAGSSSARPRCPAVSPGPPSSGDSLRTGTPLSRPSSRGEWLAALTRSWKWCWSLPGLPSLRRSRACWPTMTGSSSGISPSLTCCRQWKGRIRA